MLIIYNEDKRVNMPNMVRLEKGGNTFYVDLETYRQASILSHLYSEDVHTLTDKIAVNEDYPNELGIAISEISSKLPSQIAILPAFLVLTEKLGNIPNLEEGVKYISSISATMSFLNLAKARKQMLANITISPKDVEDDHNRMFAHFMLYAEEDKLLPVEEEDEEVASTPASSNNWLETFVRESKEMGLHFVISSDEIKLGGGVMPMPQEDTTSTKKSKEELKGDADSILERDIDVADVDDLFSAFGDVFDGTDKGEFSQEDLDDGDTFSVDEIEEAPTMEELEELQDPAVSALAGLV